MRVALDSRGRGVEREHSETRMREGASFYLTRSSGSAIGGACAHCACYAIATLSLTFIQFMYISSITMLDFDCIVKSYSTAHAEPKCECTRLARARGRARALGDSNARGREFLLDTFEWLRDWGGVCTLRVLRNRDARRESSASGSKAALLTLMEFS